MKTKTNKLTLTLAAIIAIGTASAATAAPGARPAYDKPEITILFHHTAENPYDVRLLSWFGGMASRVEIVPQTTKTFIVAYNTGNLHGAKITGAAPTTIGFHVCKNGKTTVLFDLLSLQKRETPLPELVTRVSSLYEWKLTLIMQNSGHLDSRAFARTPILREQHDQYAYSEAPAQHTL